MNPLPCPGVCRPTAHRLAVLVAIAAVLATRSASADETLNVTTTPAGAVVTVDDVELGTSPLLVPLPVGDHVVVVSLAGYESLRREVAMPRGRGISLHLSLKRPGQTDTDAALVDASGGAIAEDPTPRTRRRRKADDEPVAPEVPDARRFAVRAGLSGHTGVLGVGFEYRFGKVAVAVGTGTYAFSGGATLRLEEEGAGPYVDLALLRLTGGLFAGVGRDLGVAPAWGLALSGGYDLRPLPWLSIKAGLGVGWNPAVTLSRQLPLVVDLAVGPVF